MGHATTGRGHRPRAGGMTPRTTALAHPARSAVCMCACPCIRQVQDGYSIPRTSITSPTIEDYRDTRLGRCFLRRSAPSGRVSVTLVAFRRLTRRGSGHLVGTGHGPEVNVAAHRHPADREKSVMGTRSGRRRGWRAGFRRSWCRCWPRLRGSPRRCSVAPTTAHHPGDSSTNTSGSCVRVIFAGGPAPASPEFSRCLALQPRSLLVTGAGRQVPVPV